MTYTYDLNPNGVLILRADAHDRERLRELRTEAEEKGTPGAQVEAEALEPLLANSDLEWIRPEEIGALTDAPILGFRVGEEDPESHEPPVVAAWGFMDYQLRSFVDDLIETGQAVFTA